MSIVSDVAARTKGFDVESVLRSAMMAFWERGFSGISYTRLLSRMRVGRQSSYDTFGDQRRLFDRAIGAYGRARQPVFASLHADDAGLHTVAGLFRGAIAFFDAHPQTPACLLTRTLLEPDVEVRQAAAALHETMRSGFEHCITQSVADGTARAEVSPVAAARILMALWHGIGVEVSAGADTQSLIEGADLVVSGFAVPNGG